MEDKDLDVKIGTLEEVYWTDRLDECNKAIEILEKELKMNNAIKEMCAARIEEELGE